jgi:precorrin-2/cobalt-factor-2 C20-methyltransferase
VLSGVSDEDSLRRTLHCAENLVILKAYKGFGMIRRVLGEAGMAERSRFVSRVGHEDEAVHARLEEAPAKPHYLSLVMVPAPAQRRTGPNAAACAESDPAETAEE